MLNDSCVWAIPCLMARDKIVSYLAQNVVRRACWCGVRIVILLNIGAAFGI